MDWNGKGLISNYSGRAWTLLNDPSTYLLKMLTTRNGTDVYGLTHLPMNTEKRE